MNSAWRRGAIAASEQNDIDALCSRRLPGRKVLLSMAFVSIVGDLHAGLLLSQITYWFTHAPRTGKRKVRVFRDGYCWLAKPLTAWREECGLTKRQATRALRILTTDGWVKTEVRRFSGLAMNHIRLTSKLVDAVNEWRNQEFEDDEDEDVHVQRFK